MQHQESDAVIQVEVTRIEPPAESSSSSRAHWLAEEVKAAKKEAGRLRRQLSKETPGSFRKECLRRFDEARRESLKWLEEILKANPPRDCAVAPESHGFAGGRVLTSSY